MHDNPPSGLTATWAWILVAGNSLVVALHELDNLGVFIIIVCWPEADDQEGWTLYGIGHLEGVSAMSTLRTVASVNNAPCEPEVAKLTSSTQNCMRTTLPRHCCKHIWIPPSLDQEVPGPWKGNDRMSDR